MGRILQRLLTNHKEVLDLLYEHSLIARFGEKPASRHEEERTFAQGPWTVSFVMLRHVLASLDHIALFLTSYVVTLAGIGLGKIPNFGAGWDSSVSHHVEKCLVRSHEKRAHSVFL